MKAQMDFEEDKLNTFGRKVEVFYYCVKLNNRLSDRDDFKSNVVFICSNISIFLP